MPLERLDADLLFPARSGSLPWMPAAGESYRVIASASSSLYGGALPGGTMTISNGVNSCTMTLPETSCRLQVAAAGQQNYTVRYSGDPVYAPKTAAATLPAGDMLRIQRVGDVAGFVSSNVGGAFGFASCGTNYGPIPDQCDLHPAPGAAVMLDVSLPSSAITFVGWQGACAGSATRCSLTMPASGSLAVRAVFAPTPTTGPTPTPVAPLSMNFTGSSAISAAADGALVARYLRRLHGPTLAARLLGGNPTGATLDGIEDRVDALSPLLDVDQNGVVDADTDGVIILRYLLGYRGPALTANAIGVGARRTDPALIAADLAKLVP